MSYLNPVRLHFSGRFRADVSTVNNVTSRFDNATFDPRMQLPFSGQDDGSNWQPAGTGAWRLLDCRVKQAYRADGTAASTPAEDAVVGVAVRESGDRASAKIVDLDPDQQGVSMIFGLVVRLMDERGRSLLQGDFEPAAFFDLQNVRSSGGGDAGGSAYFQSVLKNVEWGDIAASRCLSEMKHASVAQMLSIRFVTDGYHTGGKQRGYGRITGTIGPYLEGEPRTFVVGRHLKMQMLPPPNLQIAQVDCSVDANRRKVLVDVGNLLPVDSATGDFLDRGELTMVASSGATAVPLGSLDYQGAGNYAKTAGIYEIPKDRPLTDVELTAATRNPLRMMLQPRGAATASPLAIENSDGIYARAEQFVFRLDPGASATTNVFVTKFGVPLPDTKLQSLEAPLSLRDTSPLPSVEIEPKTDGRGRAMLTITAVDPRNPRGYIDGQVYAIVYSLQGTQANPQEILDSAFADGNFISLLMFGGVNDPDSPAWDDVFPIFKQYGDLYPRPHGPDSYAPFAERPPSHPVVNLNDQDSVARFAHHIVTVLELPLDHPNHMPVTRDLSNGKRALLLKWLRDAAAGGKPRRVAEASVAAWAQSPASEPSPRFASKAFVISMARRRHKPARQG
jgi:hypothetical protein